MSFDKCDNCSTNQSLESIKRMTSSGGVDGMQYNINEYGPE